MTFHLRNLDRYVNAVIVTVVKVNYSPCDFLKINGCFKLLSIETGSYCASPFSGVSAEQCSQAVLGKRDTKQAPEGDSLSLSCVVRHCGDTWKGNWMWTNLTDKKFIKNSDQHSLTNVTLSANETRLLLNFLKINQSDEGYYGCKVTWSKGETEQGHLIYVNVTAGM